MATKASNGSVVITLGTLPIRCLLGHSDSARKATWLIAKLVAQTGDLLFPNFLHGFTVGQLLVSHCFDGSRYRTPRIKAELTWHAWIAFFAPASTRRVPSRASRASQHPVCRFITRNAHGRILPSHLFHDTIWLCGSDVNKGVILVQEALAPAELHLE